MPAHIRWMTFRLTIVAVAVLSVAFARTAAVSAYDTVVLASTAAVDGSVSQDAVPTSAGEGQATVGSAAALDTLRPGGTTDTAPLQMMDGDDDFWDSGWWIVMVVMMVLFWGGVIALAVWGIRQFTGDRRRDRSALDIAKERLAGGEITKEEFDRISGDLA